MKLPEFQITAGFYILSALAVLMLPWNMLLSFIAASLFHELCHIGMLLLFENTVQEVKLGALGAKITTGALTPLQELLCAAAGPLGSLLLMLTAKKTPFLALFGMCQGLFNLLPIYPLDGGRMIRSIFLLAKIGRWGYNRSDY